MQRFWMPSITAHVTLHNIRAHLEGQRVTKSAHTLCHKEERQFDLRISNFLAYHSLITIYLDRELVSTFLLHLDKGERKRERFYVHAAEQKTAHMNHSFMYKIHLLL